MYEVVCRTDEIGCLYGVGLYLDSENDLGLICVLIIKKKREISFLERRKREIGRENGRKCVFLVV